MNERTWESVRGSETELTIYTFASVTLDKVFGEYVCHVY